MPIVAVNNSGNLAVLVHFQTAIVSPVYPGAPWKFNQRLEHENSNKLHWKLFGPQWCNYMKIKIKNMYILTPESHKYSQLTVKFSDFHATNTILLVKTTAMKISPQRMRSDLWHATRPLSIVVNKLLRLSRNNEGPPRAARKA